MVTVLSILAKYFMETDVRQENHDPLPIPGKKRHDAPALALPASWRQVAGWVAGWVFACLFSCSTAVAHMRKFTLMHNSCSWSVRCWERQSLGLGLDSNCRLPNLRLGWLTWVSSSCVSLLEGGTPRHSLRVPQFGDAPTSMILGKGSKQFRVVRSYFPE